MSKLSLTRDSPGSARKFGTIQHVATSTDSGLSSKLGNTTAIGTSHVRDVQESDGVGMNSEQNTDTLHVTTDYNSGTTIRGSNRIHLHNSTSADSACSGASSSSGESDRFGGRVSSAPSGPTTPTLPTNEVFYAEKDVFLSLAQQARNLAEFVTAADSDDERDSLSSAIKEPSTTKSESIDLRSQSVIRSLQDECEELQLELEVHFFLISFFVCILIYLKSACYCVQETRRELSDHKRNARRSSALQELPLDDEEPAELSSRSRSGTPVDASLLKHRRISSSDAAVGLVSPIGRSSFTFDDQADADEGVSSQARKRSVGNVSSSTHRPYFDRQVHHQHNVSRRSQVHALGGEEYCSTLVNSISSTEFDTSAELRTGTIDAAVQTTSQMALLLAQGELNRQERDQLRIQNRELHAKNIELENLLQNSYTIQDSLRNENSELLSQISQFGK